MSLQVHLPGQHMVYFNTNVPIETIAARAQTERTTLTAFFNLNQLDESAHQFTYQELPQHFVWDRKKNMWNRHVRGHHRSNVFHLTNCRQALLPLDLTYHRKRTNQLGRPMLF